MATITVFADVHPALRHESLLTKAASQVVVKAHLIPHIIAYAWSKRNYILTPRDVEDILDEDCWETIDDYISYMQESNSYGELISGTTNRTRRSSLRIYSSAEVKQLHYNLCTGHDADRHSILKRVSDPWVEALPLYQTSCAQNEATLETDRPPSFVVGVASPDYGCSESFSEEDSLSNLERGFDAYKANGEGMDTDEAKSSKVGSIMYDRHLTRLEAGLLQARQMMARFWKAFSTRSHTFCSRSG